mgnify:CR=1 FL=1
MLLKTSALSSRLSGARVQGCWLHEQRGHACGSAAAHASCRAAAGVHGAAAEQVPTATPRPPAPPLPRSHATIGAHFSERGYNAIQFRGASNVWMRQVSCACACLSAPLVAVAGWAVPASWQGPSWRRVVGRAAGRGRRSVRALAGWLAGWLAGLAPASCPSLRRQSLQLPVDVVSPDKALALTKGSQKQQNLKATPTMQRTCLPCCRWTLSIRTTESS